MKLMNGETFREHMQKSLTDDPDEARARELWQNKKRVKILVDGEIEDGGEVVRVIQKDDGSIIVGVANKEMSLQVFVPLQEFFRWQK